jgi:hypothetical protein
VLFEHVARDLGIEPSVVRVVVRKPHGDEQTKAQRNEED